MKEWLGWSRGAGWDQGQEKLLLFRNPDLAPSAELGGTQVTGKSRTPAPCFWEGEAGARCLGSAVSIHEVPWQCKVVQKVVQAGLQGAAASFLLLLQWCVLPSWVLLFSTS